MGSRSPRILSSNLRGVCMHLFIVKNHSAPLSFSSLLTPTPPFFFSRAFSANLNEIPLVAPVVRDVGDPNPESEEMLPSASGPPRGANPGRSARRPGLRRSRVPRRCQLGAVGGRAVESGAPNAGFAPVCAASGHCAPSRPSLAGSDPAGAQPGQLERQAGPPWPEGRELGAFPACVPELSPHGLEQSLPACLPACLPDLLKKEKKEKKKVDILEPGARLSRRLPGLAPGRVVPVVQLAIGRSPSNFSVYCPARLRSRLGERIDGTRGGRGCAARAGTVCWAA